MNPITLWSFCCMIFITLVSGLPLLHRPPVNAARSLPPLLQPPFARVDSPTPSPDPPSWGPSIFAGALDRFAYPQTSTDYKARVGQLSQQIGQKVEPMGDKSYWRNFGHALYTSVSVMPMIMEALVKQARN